MIVKALAHTSLQMTEDGGSRKTGVCLEYLGSDGGTPWDDGVYSTIRRVVVYHREWIDSLQIEYDQDGESIWSSKHGGNEGSKSEVVLDYPNEYLVSVYGYYDDIHNREISATVIRSLTLETNRSTYGPFGVEDGTKFSFPIAEAKIVGFHGRSGWYLNAIGLHVQTTQKIGLQPRPKHFSLGQYGGEGGDPWDESFRAIKRLVIYHGMWMDSIKMEYEDENGKSAWSDKHGGGGGSRSEVVLDFPDEHLVCIHGYYGDVSKWGFAATVIRSLTLETNRRSYGPFGVEEGTKFSFPTAGVKIVGIHGRSGWYLDAIGLHALSIQDQE